MHLGADDREREANEGVAMSDRIIASWGGRRGARCVWRVSFPRDARPARQEELEAAGGGEFTVVGEALSVHRDILPA